MPVRGLNDWPMEIVERVLDYCLLTAAPSLLACNQQLYVFLIPRLYTYARIRSLDQLSRFVSTHSAARWWCPRLTESLFIEIPGLPGSSNTVDDKDDGASSVYFPEPHPLRRNEPRGPASRSARRMFAVNQALRMCRYIKRLELALFTVRHVKSFGIGYEGDVQCDLQHTFGLLTVLESITWRPPGSSGSIQGVSIALDAETVSIVLAGLSSAARCRLEGFKPEEVTNLPANISGGSKRKQPVGQCPVLATVLPLQDRGIDVGTQERNFRWHPLRAVHLHNVDLCDRKPEDATFPWSGLGDLSSTSLTMTRQTAAQDGVKPDQDTFWPLLFPQLEAVEVVSAINLSPASIARLLVAFQDRPQMLRITLKNTFRASLWEERLSSRAVEEAFPAAWSQLGLDALCRAKLDLECLRDHPKRCSCSGRHAKHSPCSFVTKAFSIVNGLLHNDLRCALVSTLLHRGSNDEVWPWTHDIWAIDIPLFLRMILSYLYFSLEAEGHLEPRQWCEEDILKNLALYRDFLRSRFNKELFDPSQETLRFEEGVPSLLILEGLTDRLDAYFREQSEGEIIPGQQIWHRETNLPYPNGSQASTNQLERFLDQRIIDLCKPLLSRLKLSRLEGAIGGGHTRQELDDEDDDAM